MQFKYILLKGFKRFPLRDTVIFEHTFTNKLVNITGPNGSGKSSLVSELTPLPSNKSDFDKDGYKEIHIEKDNNIYKLISDFTNGAKYSFYLHEENLNTSNNITMQKELVYKHFGITNSIHDILTGVETFTSMSLLTRKKLFNSITHLNIDKIIEGYNSLKEELKNNEFSLKTQISLQQSEEQKLINKAQYTELVNSQMQIKEYIDFLLQLRAELARYITPTDLDATYQDYVNSLNGVSSVITKYYTHLTSYPQNKVETYKSQLDIINFKLKTLYQLHETTQEKINVITANRQVNLETLKQTLSNLTSSKFKIQSNLSILKDTTLSHSQLQSNLHKLEGSLNSIVNSIPLNADKRYSKEKYENFLLLKKQKLDELSATINKESDISKQIDHILTHRQDIECPQCSFKWILQEKKEDIETLTTSKKELLHKIVTIKEELEKLDSSITSILEYFAIYKQYATLRSLTHVDLKPFWDIVDSNEYIFKNPLQINVLLTTLSVEVMSIEEIETISSKIKELTPVIELLETVKDTAITTLESELQIIDSDITTLLYIKNNIVTCIEDNEIAKSSNSMLNAARMRLEASTSDLFTANVSYAVSDVIRLIDLELSKYKVTLIEKEKEIISYNNVTYTIEKYNKQIEDIRSNIKVLTATLTELSPKNGLIAKSVSSFLNIIIKNINNLIASIWEYQMSLVAIDVEDEVLNYKFKVNVEDKLVISDVNSCSAGMQKIINFSFVLLLYKLLKLEGYPLYLDEFTTNLDTVHSRKFAYLISQLALTDKHSQVFVISHISNDLYTSNSECDVIDLS